MVEIRKADKNELQALIPIFKESYKEHYIFNKGDNDILHYLEDELTTFEKVGNDGAVFIAELNNEIIGTCMLVLEDIHEEEHSIWRIKNLAMLTNFKQIGVEKQLIEQCLKQVRDLIASEKSVSAKIEVHVAGDDSNSVSLYEKIGFKQEGILLDHYRLGENTTVLGLLMKR